MSTIAGHSADYDREIVEDLSDAELAQRRAQVLALQEQADVQLRKCLPDLATSARQLYAEGRLHALRPVLLELAEMSLGSSAVLLHDCCLALAEELAVAVHPRSRERFGVKSHTELAGTAMPILLDECSRLLANREPPAQALIRYVQHFWQDTPMSLQSDSDA